MKEALIFGAGGFIGNHMVNKLKKKGYWVRGVDLKYPEFSETKADEFIIGDLRNVSVCKTNLIKNNIYKPINEIYQFAADMGGASYIFTGEHDADIMHNSSLINLNILKLCSEFKTDIKIFYSSSACIYPEYNQLDPDNPKCSEDSAFPAAPDSI